MILNNWVKCQYWGLLLFVGQGYRCIRVNGHSRRDATLESAANAAGVKYEDLSLPVELTLWVDPKEVCCRFGETKGSYCTLASFDDKENIVPLIKKHIEKVEKVEKQVIEEVRRIIHSFSVKLKWRFLNECVICYFQKPATNNTTSTVSTHSKSKPLAPVNQNQTSSNNNNNSTSNNNNNSTSNINVTSSNINSNHNSHSNNNNNGPNKRRNLNSPRLHLNRNRSWFNHSFMGYGPHPMSQPWYNVMPPHFLGGPSPPPFIGGHRASKWIHSSSYPNNSRFHHWSPKATLKV